MSKIRETYTIDEELSRWIRMQDAPSASWFVNKILVEYKEKHSSFNDKLDNLKNLKEKEEAEEKKIIEELSSVIENSDKKAREVAERHLEELKKKEQEKSQEIEKLANILKKSKLFEELMNCNNVQELWQFNKKLMEKDIKINKETSIAGFGIKALREITESYGKHIPLEIESNSSQQAQEAEIKSGEEN